MGPQIWRPYARRGQQSPAPGARLFGRRRIRTTGGAAAGLDRFLQRSALLHLGKEGPAARRCWVWLPIGPSWRHCDQRLLPRISTDCVALCPLLLAIPEWSLLQLCLRYGMLPVGRIFRMNLSCLLSGVESRGMLRLWTCSVRVSPPFHPGTCPRNSLRACLLTFGVSWTSDRV